MKARHVLLLAAGMTLPGAAGGNPEWENLGSAELERYFANRVAALEKPLRGIEALGEWNEKRDGYRRDLRGMLGLDPLPERTPLQATITGTIEREDFTVEKLHFQSSPGLYVTANLYLPVQRDGKVPAVLYVCGHGASKEGEVSYGNKVTYQHHGIWFARNGYACLIIDTLQMGEIEGIHHGLYRHDRWWWLSRGYTPAGVEAWNCMRALDYLQSRPEVDGARLGVTGRSGGGAYSWWIAALDERIVAAVPVAGITSLRDHVVHGCVEGHCDCMYQVNSRAWDFEQVAALVAPRALLISNTDKDDIFPLEGVYQVYREARRIYDLYGAEAKLGLNIEEGPHQDTQPLRTSAFHWMNRHLKGTERGDTFEMAAVKLFEPRELKVFDVLPADQINTRIDELFVPKAPEPAVPPSEAGWEEMKEGWMTGLKENCFRGWPDFGLEPKLREVKDEVRDGIRGRVFEVETERDVTCWLAIAHHASTPLPDLASVSLTVLDQMGWTEWDRSPGVPEKDQCLAYFCPRGIGEDPWTDDKRKQTQIRRRFVLVGQTLDGMRVWDARQAVRALRSLLPEDAAVTLHAEGEMAGNVLHASLFLERPVSALVLRNLPASHHEGPHYLNVLKVLDLPQAVAMAAERSSVTIRGEAAPWNYPQQIAREFDWTAGRFVIKGDAP